MASVGNVSKQIKDLPEELLIDIFGNLNGSDLLEASLAAKNGI